MKRRFARLSAWSGLALTLFCLLGIPHPARAANINCSGATVTFTFGTGGNINPYSGYPYSTSGSVPISCTNSGPTATIYGCFSLGAGTGGITPSNRALASGANTLLFQISPTIGDTGATMYGPFSLSITGYGTTPTALPISATIPTPGSAPPAGAYTTNFSGASAVFYYATTSQSTCSAIVGASPQTGYYNLTFNTTVVTQCKITATNMTFPAKSVLSVAATATATVTTTCNASVPVTVALDNGATGTGPTARLMKSGANSITYGIYQDAAMTQPWGSTAGSNTQSLANGSGSLTAYGNVPAQASPAPGTYNDTVNVNISY